jgi:hypothetical protein
MFDAERFGNFNVLSHLSTSFLSVGFKEYGAFGLLSFPLAFGLASIEGRPQRTTKSFLTFMLSLVKLVTLRHMLMILFATFRSWCIKSMLWGIINTFALGSTQRQLLCVYL